MKPLHIGKESSMIVDEEPAERSYTLNLSRWHKVTERLNEALMRDSQLADRTFTSTRVSSWNQGKVAEYLYLQKSEAEEALNRHSEILKAIGSIRRSLGEKNAQLGISQLITDAELINRRIKLLERILGGQEADMVGADDLLRLSQEHMSREKQASYTVTVRLLDTGEREALRNELARLRSAHHAMLDQASDLNREKVTLTLGNEIADLGGLLHAKGL